MAPTPFTSWQNVPLPSTIVAHGIGQPSSYDYDPATKQVSNVVPGGVAGGYSAEMAFDSGGALVGLKFATPTTALSFASNEIFILSTEMVGATSRTSNALLANPMTPGWNYQTFGVWETGLDTTTGSFGAMSVGTASPGLPAKDATFKGSAAGSWVNADGIGHVVLADLTVGLSGQTLTVNTANTRTSQDWQTFTLAPSLEMSGTLTVSGTNGFSGSLATQDLRLTGTSTGQFYGPNAEELGGLFFLQGAGETYSGAYGAKTVP